MSNFAKKGILLLLVLCLLQGAFVPSVAAATSSDSVVYDFYTPWKNYNYLFHWRVPGEGPDDLPPTSKIAQSDIAIAYPNDSNWKIESTSGYADVVKKTFLGMETTGWISINMGQNAAQVFRLKSPGTANYKVVLNYIATKASEANKDVELLIIPAVKDSYSGNQIAELLSQHRYQERISFDGAVTSFLRDYEEKTVTISESYPFLENQDYFFVVRGGQGGRVYLQNLTVTWEGEYQPPEESKYARPVTILDEALTKWDDDFSCVVKIGDDDYFAVPIAGGKMYIYNLDTWELVNEVNTGISTPRGIVVDDKGVLYLGGDSYNLFIYDLNTWTARTSAKFNITNVAAGSLYDIHLGDDGNLYTGTDKGHILQYNPDEDKFSSIAHGQTGIGYVPTVIQKNKIEDGVENKYIYAAMHTTTKDLLVELKWDADAQAYQYSRTCDFTSTEPSTYLTYMSMTKDGVIFGGSNQKLMAIDTNTMTLLELKDQNGKPAPAVNSYVSEEINGMHYYVAAGENKDRYLCVYDPQTKTVTKTNHHIGQYFDCQGNTVTLPDKNGVESEHLIATADAQVLIYFVNVNPDSEQYGQVWQSKKEPQGPQDKPLLVDPNAGAGSGVNSLTLSADGTKLYYGGFLSDKVTTYDIKTGIIGTQYTVSGIQTDAICVYDGQIYAGNYTEGQLTKVNLDKPSEPTVLFTLHNSLFNQSRIHSIVGGDNKIFLGTFPYVYAHGGVLAWYDLDLNRTCVAVGPYPEDVYYSADSVNWYDNEQLTGAPVTAISGTADDGMDGVDGVVLNQGIKDVAYHNGILYAATSRSGGTNTNPVTGTSAVIIAYDVAAKKVIATFDPTEEGFAGPVPMISGIEVDENGTLWCVVSETLFTLTLNDDNTFTYAEKLSFDKYSYDSTQNRSNSDIRFKDGYVYVAFERLGGLCKVSITNPTKDYTMLMPEVTSNGQVPESFVVVEDEEGNDNLYYLHGSALKMLTLEPTATEWESADTVTEQISTVTTDTAAQVRQAYDALTLRQKSLVQNYAVLEQAEADAFMQQIADLGEITWEKREQVQALLAAYKQLPKSQQNRITNYPLLAAASQTLQEMMNTGILVKLNDSDEELIFQTLEEALEAATDGTIILRRDITSGTVDLGTNVLDLNGHTLTADCIVGKVTDSADGEGLIKVSKNSEEKSSAVFTPVDGQLILWDNTTHASGYRIFNYTFINKGMDANKNEGKDDASVSEELGVTMRSFWSDLSFENRRAYTLLASAAAYSDLTVGFEVSWTPDNGETKTKTFVLEPATITQWAKDEENNVDNEKDYCFFVSLTGFEALKTSGLVEVKPILKTAFNEDVKDATEFKYDYKTSVDCLEYVYGFDVLPVA